MLGLGLETKDIRINSTLFKSKRTQISENKNYENTSIIINAIAEHVLLDFPFSLLLLLVDAGD